MRTISRDEAIHGWEKLAAEAQRQPIRVEGAGVPEVIVMSAVQYEHIRDNAKARLLALMADMRREAGAKGLTEEKLNELLADES